jgi:hypothetical protein
MKYLFLLCYLITPVNAWFSDNNIDKIQEHYDKRLIRVEAFMNHYGIQKKTEIAGTVKSLRPDLSMLAILVGIIPDDKSLDHYFTADGRITEDAENNVRCKYTTVWQLLDEYSISYDKEAKMPYCGQALGVSVVKNGFDKIIELVINSYFGIGTPNLHDIFILKNNDDPDAEPKCVSAIESCEPVLRILERFLPNTYSKLKGHIIYHSDNGGPSRGRSGDFAVLTALLNAIYNRPCKQLVFTGEIKDDGSLFQIGAARIKNKAAKAVEMPLVVEQANYNELKGDNALCTNQDDLAEGYRNHPNLDKEALERMNAYKPFLRRQRIFKAYKAFAICYGTLYLSMLALHLYNTIRTPCTS